MQAVRVQLRRLARAQARAMGSRRAARWHLGLLVFAIVLAFVHRAVHPVPGFGHLAGAWLPALGAAAALYFAGRLLRPLAAWLARPAPGPLARRLDDRFHWRDETTTALALDDRRRGRPVGALLLAQTEGRLRDVSSRRLGRVTRPRRWLRRVLALLFAAVLLLPGVDGLFGDTGAGRQGEGLVGSEGPQDPFGTPRPMRADLWLTTFVDAPLPVEPLPGEAAAAGEGAEDGR